jgi:ABC-2 type transport system permease protein
VGKALPLKHLNEGMLDTMVRGDGPSSAVLPMVFLLVFAAVVTTIAATFFRWDD